MITIILDILSMVILLATVAAFVRLLYQDIKDRNE